MEEFEKIYNILASFLGESKKGFDSKCFQYQFPCPRCVENKGEKEIHKANLEVNFQKQVFKCWSCCDDGDTMQGSILKLIKLYGNEELLKDYKEAVRSLRESKLYKMNFSDDDFNIDTKSIEIDDLRLPKGFSLIREDRYCPPKLINYLNSRGIGWDIIDEYSLGYVGYNSSDYMASNRVYIPSHDKYGDLNYWTGRDFLNRKNVVKYYNPEAKRKTIIFNEEKVQWDADVTLVEGPFDHIVVPNSIPLLGKVIDTDFRLFWEILKNAKGKINIFLDGDATESVRKIYKQLNHGDLYNRIRYIPVNDKDLDPSKIYELYGKNGIIQFLRSATKIDEIYL